MEEQQQHGVPGAFYHWQGGARVGGLFWLAAGQATPNRLVPTSLPCLLVLGGG